MYLPSLPSRNISRIALLASLVGMLAATSDDVLAANTDIATAPLFTTGTTVVKPNLMFVLDDSGSMDWDFLPDDADFSGSPSSNGTGVQYGLRSAQCNGVAYSPDAALVPYSKPQDSTGAELANASLSFLTDANAKTGTTNQRPLSQMTVTPQFSGNLSVTVTANNKQSTWYPVGAVVTVFNNASGGGGAYMMGTVVSWNSNNSGTGAGALVIKIGAAVGSGDLTITTVGNGTPALQMYYTYSGSQPAMSYKYPGNSLNTGSTFYQECSSTIGASPGAGVFTANFVTASSAEAQRYANWYQYYRTRMAMMKTSVSRAFSVMDNKYRVGFSTISEKTAAEGANFLDVRDFDSTQKLSFYTKLNAAEPGGNTPLRAALSKAGRYFARKVSGQTYDPVQYSCQKNFTMLSTDGYWNTQNETSTYGPDKLDGSTSVGEQDGGATQRPQFDGNVSTATTIQRWTSTSYYDKTTLTPSNVRTVNTTAVAKAVPYQGKQRTTYSWTKSTYTTQATSSISRCSSLSSGKCTITVTTNNNHGYSTGDTVTISGVTPAVYNGAFVVTSTGNKTFTYQLIGLSAVPANDTAVGVSGKSTSGCPSGQGTAYGQMQTSDLRHVTTTVTTSSITNAPSTNSLVQRYTTTTSYTRTIVSVNGMQSSDNTTNTVSNTGPTTRSNTNTAGAATSETVPAPTSSTVDDQTAWVNSGSPVAGACATSQPATTATSDVPVSTQTVTTTTPTSTPTSTTGAATSSNEAAVVSNSAVTTTTTNSSSGGSSSSLADVAQYYYQTDLRNAGLSNCTGALGTQVCDDNVTPLGLDTAAWQHMSTYTLSLGNSGTLAYDMDYQNQLAGDYRDIVNGNKNWPVPSSDAGAVNIDDLWHAAVNGRGRYFSASNPSTLATSLNAALSSIQAQVGSGSAAATSTLQPVQGDNGAFVAQFRSSEWTGDVKGYALNVSTGAVHTSTLDASGNRVDTALWSASDKLTSSYARTIYYFRPTGAASGSGTLQSFDYSTMNAAEKANFDNACTKSPALSQCVGLSGTALAQVNSGASMVSFLRGQAQPQFRTPAKLLGDIVNSSPVYVGKPNQAYSENGYAAFKSRNASRKATIYVGANDGMLHAFNAESTTDGSGNLLATADSGKERWAYVPNLVMSNLYQLGDQFYASKHQYFVDGTPVVSDVFDGSSWRTILVGGLNAGGRGYYALDITNPLAPVALWEFVPSTMGLSYGNPVIAKRADGTWIVALTSGHNNADGDGHFYVLNAVTGVLLKQIDTGAGAAGSPSGLNKINAWIESTTEKLAKRFYGGDLMGNVWRFDIDNLVEPHGAAFKLAQLADAVGKPQPITTMLRLALVEGNQGNWPVVFVGTGLYLGRTDVSSTNQQSVYAIKDNLDIASLGDVRAGGTLVRQTVDTSVAPRKVGNVNTPVDWSVKNGWYVDLASTAERVNVDMLLVGDTLSAIGNMPGSTATDCTSAGNGTSWLYLFNIATGVGIAQSFGTMLAGLSPEQLETGEILLLPTGSDGDPKDPVTAGALDDAGRAPRRSAWRELID